MKTDILQQTDGCLNIGDCLNNSYNEPTQIDNQSNTKRKFLSQRSLRISGKVFLLMAGGTGGHIFPGLAVAEVLQQRGFTIHWLGTKEGMEADLVPKYGFPISFLPVKGVRGKGLKALLIAPWRILKSTLQALCILRKIKPVAVLGMGGFVSGPGSLAAYLLRIPLIIHEQNAVAGITNRLAAPMAKKILTGFPQVLSTYKKTLYTGNPVRNSIRINQTTADNVGPSSLRLLVLGGSRGALIMNTTLPEALSKLDNPVEVIHQCGAGNEKKTTDLYQRHHIVVKVTAFIDNMAQAYAWADLVICRSGALTVAELACAGKPSILIPYPWHKDQQQVRNAEYLVNHGAATIIEQKDLSTERLALVIKQISENKSSLKSMRQAAFCCAKPNAVTTIADICETTAGE